MNGTLSEFLNLLDLRGQTWCFVDIRSCCGFSIPRNDDVLFYGVIHGSVQIDGVAGGTLDLRSGNVAMILSGDAHRVCINTDSPTQALDFLCDEQNIDVPPVISSGGSGPVSARVLSARLKVSWPRGLRRVAMPPVVTIGTDRSTFSGFSAIRAETLQLSAVGSGAAAQLTRIAALMLTVSLRSHPQCQLLFRSSTWSDPIAHALHLIASDPSADWSVAQLAQKVGMGRSSFAAHFTEQVGRTPMDVITERRMQHAAELLQQSELKLIDISSRAGYRSEAAFSRRFTLYFGLSPSSMRRNARMSKKSGADISPLHALVAGAHQPSG
ncbi:MAG: btr [Hydrocarboniphaga sp.]|uniref:helix-turn-helix domain-containing protein n=1 Tax=Hydrocarboniphaga sp. TaxID=2033016 RepID=UPI002616B945|nr:AraC family transcriptional regulator [Hydrocarboniphaga sp.]MDB5970611.1 btr [Hydrocarboniphaga sp.]